MSKKKKKPFSNRAPISRLGPSKDKLISANKLEIGVLRNDVLDLAANDELADALYDIADALQEYL